MRRLHPLAFLVALLLSAPAFSQTNTLMNYKNGTSAVQVSPTNPLPVSASVSASITGFPGASPTTGTPISVTTGGVTGTLPAGAVVVASNVGTTNIAYCKLGASATTSDQPIAPNGGWFAFTVGAATQLTCITSTSTTTVNMVGGAGLPTGTGGGGGGSGGGGAITAASGSYASGALSAGSVAAGAGVDGWDLTQGAKADSACGTATGTCSVVALLKFLNTAASNGTGLTGAAPPASAIYIGANTGGATGGFQQGLIQCNSYVFKHITSATDTLAVQGVASQTIYICGFHARAAGTATWFLENTASTNANCGSSNTQISILNSEVANSGIVDRSPFWSGLKNTAGNGLCINSTGTGGVDVGIYYTQF